MFKTFTAGSLLGTWLLLTGTAAAGEYALTIDEKTVNFTGTETTALAIDGSIPAPLLRFTEGEDVTIHVTNNLDESSSIHWHGLLLPPEMDGVPGISFDGIPPGETFTYRFPVRQTGTYWYHSHSGYQEQEGLYGPMIIDPAGPDPVAYDREFVILLSDWKDDDPADVHANLKSSSDYYNYAQRTVFDFFDDASEMGLSAAVSDRMDWGDMRMMPSDISDVSGYTFLMNGQTTDTPWSGRFTPGERIRLRFINGSAMSYFDVRIPGLKMDIVQTDGQNVVPVTVDEFRIAVAETYDVIVTPQTEKDVQILAEAMDRTGFAAGVLTTGDGPVALTLPPSRPRSLLTMADMGMSHGGMSHGGMDHGNMDQGDMDHSAMGHDMPASPSMNEERMDHGNMDHGNMDHAAMGHDMPPADSGEPAGMDHAAMGHAKSGDEMGGMQGPVDNHVHSPPVGAPAGAKVLSYADLAALEPNTDLRDPGREIVVRLGGNMERYIWTLNGQKFADADPIMLRYGERVRLTFINETMMNHPMHLHGMFVELENGQPAETQPRKHVVNVGPGRTYSVDINATEAGEWAFHCHLMYHMSSGMFRKVVVAKLAAEAVQ
ncbi:MAG: copper resistance system multicopper oxidase [Parvibaculaceae bacterium]